MIAHVSMPADDCRRVAAVLAAMMKGGALPFPPGGWNAWSCDNGFQIVVTPRGRVLVPGPEEQEWTPELTPRGSECHFAIVVPRSATEIVAMAREEGWKARICDRGGFFDVAEVWVENAFLVEMLDETQAAEYRRSMTPDRWRAAFGLD